MENTGMRLAKLWVNLSSTNNIKIRSAEKSKETHCGSTLVQQTFKIELQKAYSEQSSGLANMHRSRFFDLNLFGSKLVVLLVEIETGIEIQYQ